MADMETLVNKPWGKEEILELNEAYMVKRLTMQAGHQCSLQRHRSKQETFVLLSGEMELTIEDSFGDLQVTTVEPGQCRTILPGTVHRMKALTDIVYIEASTPHLDDVIRLEDDYARA